MTGLDCPRCLAHLPSDTPLRPQKISSKSLFRNILPATHSVSAGCTEILAILMKTRNFGGEGEGYPMSWHSQIGKLNSPESTVCHRFLAYFSAITINFGSVMSSMEKRRPSRPRPESLTPP